MAAQSGGRLDTVMHEDRLFPPPKQFAAKARIDSPAAYEEMWREAAADIDSFWAKFACELHWFKPYQKCSSGTSPSPSGSSAARRTPRLTASTPI